MARLGIISAYPDEDWHASRILAAARRAADADELSPLDFSAEALEGSCRVTIRGAAHERYDALLLPRALGEEGDHELQLELYRTLEDEGALLVNGVSALTRSIDKWKTSWILRRAGVPTPQAAVVQREDEAVALLSRLGGVAVGKPLYGSLGIGVTLIDTASAAIACLRQNRALYLQEFVGVRSGVARDVRAFVVGSRVAAAMVRRAAPGEFRTNVHQGGEVAAVRLSARAERIAVSAAAALGLDYAGVDLVEGRTGPTVIEVNGTPLFAGILRATGRDMAEVIVEHALGRVRRRQVESGPTRPEGPARRNQRWRGRAQAARET